ncbi:MAG TPA: hypothetical protein EYP55_05865 [Anaerolineae bacterium]|nr:hypothetical protein [Anaerolineae bacterium]
MGENFRHLVKVLPGYQGYKEKEVRREADKRLRMHLARGFEEQRGRINEIQTQLTDKGRLASVVTLERAMLRLQLLIDRLKTASYGYAGWFDAIQVEEKELEALYAFDSALTESLAQVTRIIDLLAKAVARDENPSSLADDLLATLEEINTTFSRRQDVILGI